MINNASQKGDAILCTGSESWTGLRNTADRDCWYHSFPALPLFCCPPNGIQFLINEGYWLVSIILFCRDLSQDSGHHSLKHIGKCFSDRCFDHGDGTQHATKKCKQRL